MQQFLITPPNGPPQIIQIPLSVIAQANSQPISFITQSGQIYQIPTNFNSIPAATVVDGSATGQTTTMTATTMAPQAAITTQVITQQQQQQQPVQTQQVVNSMPTLVSSSGTVVKKERLADVDEHGPSMASTASSSGMNTSMIMNTSSSSTSGGGGGTTVNGVNLDEIKEFAKAFKLRRLALGLTQTQLGQALSATRGPAYSQSAICRFEKLDITPQSAAKIKPVLEKWMQEVETKYGQRLRAGGGPLTFDDLVDDEANKKKRKRRTSFTPEALAVLNDYFEKNPNPSADQADDISMLSQKLNYDREVIRVWFCNKRQALKNSGRKPGSSTCNMSTDDLSSTYSLSSPGTTNTTTIGGDMFQQLTNGTGGGGGLVQNQIVIGQLVSTSQMVDHHDNKTTTIVVDPSGSTGNSNMTTPSTTSSSDTGSPESSGSCTDPKTGLSSTVVEA